MQELSQQNLSSLHAQVKGALEDYQKQCLALYGSGAEGFMPNQETLDKRAEAMSQLLLKRLVETETPIETFDARSAAINHITPYWKEVLSQAEQRGVAVWLNDSFKTNRNPIDFQPKPNDPAYVPKDLALETVCLKRMAEHPLDFLYNKYKDPAPLRLAGGNSEEIEPLEFEIIVDSLDVDPDVIWSISQDSNRFESTVAEQLPGILEAYEESFVSACEQGLHQAQAQILKKVGPGLMAQAFAEGKTNSNDIAAIINGSEGINQQIEQARKSAGLPLEHFSLDESKKVLSIESFGANLSPVKVIKNLEQAKDAKFITEVHLINGTNRSEFKQVAGVWQEGASKAPAALSKSQTQDVLQAINKPVDLEKFLQATKNRGPAKQDAFDR